MPIDLPPGCTMRDLERAWGDAPDEDRIEEMPMSKPKKMTTPTLTPDEILHRIREAARLLAECAPHATVTAHCDDAGTLPAALLAAGGRTYQMLDERDARPGVIVSTELRLGEVTVVALTWRPLVAADLDGGKVAS